MGPRQEEITFLEAHDDDKGLLSRVGTLEGALVQETSLAGNERERRKKLKANQKMTLSPALGEGASFITQEELLHVPITMAPDFSEVRGQAGSVVRGNLLGITGIPRLGRTSLVRVASVVVL